MLYFSRRPDTAEEEWNVQIDYIVLENNTLTVQGKRVDILAVIRPGHVFLSQTNGIFSFGNTIEVFEVTFGDALRRTH